MQNTGTMSTGSGAHHSSHSPKPIAPQVEDSERRSNRTRTDESQHIPACDQTSREIAMPDILARLRPLLKEILQTLSNPNKVPHSRDKKVTISAPLLLREANMTLLPWGEESSLAPTTISWALG